MNLNTISPADGSRKKAKRVGRGIGSGSGKTCDRGHKGQKSRSGGYHKRGVGFEGGQMPLARRLPKFGFNSQKALYTTELRLSDLQNIDADVIDLAAVKAAGFASNNIKTIKVIAGTEISKAVTTKGLRVTAGAKQAIEAAGGKVEEE